jgi:hypothetical protein
VQNMSLGKTISHQPTSLSRGHYSLEWLPASTDSMRMWARFFVTPLPAWESLS